MATLERILFVEDDLDIQEIARLALQMVGGFDVSLMSSGEEALEKAKDLNPQLILLDVMMPGMDGPSTLRELRKMPEFTNIPVIFMTARVQPHEVAEYKELGALDVISKPFDPMTLSNTILSIWEQHQGS
ncbi:MAG TPA: hypothetical protein DCE42_18440 [Myxococcales bacterium]|nr:hypothetical protein [Deltaproteobacteria bacterium]MBU49857.1 hypothetical protein [Deltaproteobacteria bacterium]HAA56751.1 hypothetical protein [Myxococcales bacterium]